MRQAVLKDAAIKEVASRMEQKSGLSASLKINKKFNWIVAQCWYFQFELLHMDFFFIRETHLLRVYHALFMYILRNI